MRMNRLVRLGVRWASVFGVLCVAWGLCGSGAHAAMLGLTQQYPDIAVPNNFSYISYTNGTFTAAGDPQQYTVGPEDNPTTYNFDTPESSRSFSLTALLDPLTGSPTGGSLSISGSITDLSVGGDLLTGTLDQFGFLDEGGDFFEFVYNVTGGALASQFGGAGSGKVGLIMYASNSGFTGSLTADFAVTGEGDLLNSTVDAFICPVPEPSSMVLLLLLTASGLVTIALRRSRMICRA
jgi:hypothetical protein